MDISEICVVTSVRTRRRAKFLARCAALGATLALAGCIDRLGSSGPSAPIASPPPVAETVGTGSVKVAMVLPTSAGGQSSQLAQQLKNAADLALRELPGSDIQIIVKDDGVEAMEVPGDATTLPLPLAPLARRTPTTTPIMTRAITAVVQRVDIFLNPQKPPSSLRLLFL